jgi:hypothetical protein
MEAAPVTRTQGTPQHRKGYAAAALLCGLDDTAHTVEFERREGVQGERLPHHFGTKCSVLHRQQRNGGPRQGLAVRALGAEVPPGGCAPKAPSLLRCSLTPTTPADRTLLIYAAATLAGLAGAARHLQAQGAARHHRSVADALRWRRPPPLVLRAGEVPGGGCERLLAGPL